MSNRVNTTHTVEGFFGWGYGARGTGRYRFDLDHKESATVTAQLWVKRGSDVKPRDRILRSNGQEYAVVGHSMWDQDSPITGRDFGYTLFQVVSTNG
ncbi:hypothetical protein A5747_13360 [Mycobacterium sp. IS-836]|nr:hypothetical protein A5747_13360 [Mycobacterium sp. IS-836]